MNWTEFKQLKENQNMRTQHMIQQVFNKLVQRANAADPRTVDMVALKNQATQMVNRKLGAQ